MYETIKYEIRDNIAYVTVSRPEALNAISTTVLTELKDVFQKIENDPEAKIVILTGEGKAFVAGADIAQMSALSGVEGHDMIKFGADVMNYMEAIDKPIIAAVNGFALGGGCELAMACDIRIASAKAKFGQPEVNLGIIPGFGGTQRLPRLVGKGMGKYLIMTAEMIGADEACRLGLVEKVVAPEELIPECERIAKTILSKAPIAIATAKRVINKGAMLDVPAGVALESEAFTVPFCSEDRIEGMKAFLEKREAEFKNR